MKILSLLSLVLLQLLPQATAEVELKSKFKNKFGQIIKVIFTNTDAKKTNWLGVYRTTDDATLDTTDVLWASMCGDQASWNESCEAKESGTVRFKTADPDLGTNGNQMPLNPNKYKVCLMDGEDVPYTIVKCKVFQVRSLNAKHINESSLSLTKTRFDYGETISANYATQLRIPNTWTGIFDVNEISNDTKELPDPIYWLYNACNNQLGNQPESENCSLRKKRGLITFDETSQDDGSWPAPPGSYVLCWSFFINEPYRKFTCSGTFDIGDITGVSLNVPSEIAFGSSIEVTTTNPTAFATDWLAIHSSSADSLVDSELHWSSMCGDQNDGCDALTSSTVSFGAVDPDQEYDEQWPISPGSRKVCLMNGDDEFEREILCKAFTISELPSNAITDSTLTTEATFDYGEPITAVFNAAVAIQNTWVGIYRSSSVTSSMTELTGEPMLWVYSACNNQAGDQIETNNCVATKTTGSIQIDSSSQDKSSETWPIAADTYVVCMSFYNNSPYSKFICSETFQVLA